MPPDAATAEESTKLAWACSRLQDSSNKVMESIELLRATVVFIKYTSPYEGVRTKPSGAVKCAFKGNAQDTSLPRRVTLICSYFFGVKPELMFIAGIVRMVSYAQ